MFNFSKDNLLPQDKRSIIYLIISVAAFILAAFLIWYFTNQPKIPEPVILETPPSNKKQMEIKKQLEELEALRAESATLTEKEIKDQLKELDKLRQNQKPLSQEEIEKQLQELEKLRQK